MLLTEAGAKRAAQRKSWDVEREEVIERAEMSQEEASLVVVWGQNQSKPVMERWWERNLEVIGSGEGEEVMAARTEAESPSEVVWPGKR